MAQTKRKRKTKHRGNAAGIVEQRGRPGSKLSDDARKSRETRATANPNAKKKTREQLREERMTRPPTWTGAAWRAAAAAGFLFLAFVFIIQRPVVASIVFAVVVFGIYVPISYYADRFVYRRRVAKKAKARS